MGQFDAATVPMHACFSRGGPPLYRSPHTAVCSRNPKTASPRNLRMDLLKEDAADDILLNEVVWRSVRR